MSAPGRYIGNRDARHRALGGLSPTQAGELSLTPRIDELFTRWPFLGSRPIAAML